jgi:hypothetical protein
MRSWTIVGLVGLCLLASGCQLTCQIARNLCFEASLGTEKVCSDCYYAYLAREAYKQYCSAHPDKASTKDFARGFKEGYATYLEEGGSVGEPPLSPEYYWRTRYQNPAGRAAARSWFAGYKEGASAAKASGYRDYVTVPVGKCDSSHPAGPPPGGPHPPLPGPGPAAEGMSPDGVPPVVSSPLSPQPPAPGREQELPPPRTLPSVPPAPAPAPTPPSQPDPSSQQGPQLGQTRANYGSLVWGDSPQNPPPRRRKRAQAANGMSSFAADSPMPASAGSSARLGAPAPTLAWTVPPAPGRVPVPPMAAPRLVPSPATVPAPPPGPLPGPPPASVGIGSISFPQQPEAESSVPSTGFLEPIPSGGS